MTWLSGPGEFAYGNTRLRARKAMFLGATEYQALVGQPVESITEALAETAYAADVETALARGPAQSAAEAALRRHLGRAFEEMRSFYDDRARRLVDLLLARFDLHNLLALLRAQVRDQPAEQALAATVPVGALGGAAAAEVARLAEPAAAVELLLLWRLPDPDTARALARAWPELERTQNLAALERTLSAAHALRVTHELAELGGEAAAPLRELLRRERDATNALTALRLREALELGEVTEPPPVPHIAGGRISAEALEAAVRAPARADAAAVLADASARGDWRAPLERYAGGGDLALLERELEAARVRFAVGLFARGDPLSTAVPIAYTTAKENEVRNLRAVLHGAAANESAESVRLRLLLPELGASWAS